MISLSIQPQASLFGNFLEPDPRRLFPRRARNGWHHFSWSQLFGISRSSSAGSRARSSPLPPIEREGRHQRSASPTRDEGHGSNRKSGSRRRRNASRIPVYRKPQRRPSMKHSRSFEDDDVDDSVQYRCRERRYSLDQDRHRSRSPSRSNQRRRSHSGPSSSSRRSNNNHRSRLQRTRSDSLTRLPPIGGRSRYWIASLCGLECVCVCDDHPFLLTLSFLFHFEPSDWCHVACLLDLDCGGARQHLW